MVRTQMTTSEFLDRVELTDVPRAFMAAQWLHAQQTRKQEKADSENVAVPYLTHLIDVLGLMLQGGATPAQQVAGLLHDALEDQPCTPDGHPTIDFIRDAFGDEVLAMVENCSDVIPVCGQPSGEKGPWPERKKAHIRHIDAQATQNADFLLIILCDKLSNARSIVADVRVHGGSVWERFKNNGDPRCTAWYYSAMLQVLIKHKEALPQAGALLIQLEHAVIDLTAAADLAAATKGLTGPLKELPSTLAGILA